MFSIQNCSCEHHYSCNSNQFENHSLKWFASLFFFTSFCDYLLKQIRKMHLFSIYMCMPGYTDTSWCLLSFILHLGQSLEATIVVPSQFFYFYICLVVYKLALPDQNISNWHGNTFLRQTHDRNRIKTKKKKKQFIF